MSELHKLIELDQALWNALVDERDDLRKELSRERAARKRAEDWAKNASLVAVQDTGNERIKDLERALAEAVALVKTMKCASEGFLKRREDGR